jgi:hypothetical protein
MRHRSSDRCTSRKRPPPLQAGMAIKAETV